MYIYQKYLFLSFILYLSIILFAGCSDSSVVNQRDNTIDYTQSVEASLKASTGGVLTLPDGATLNIPPGVLPSDTVVTFSYLNEDRNPTYYDPEIINPGDDNERYYEITPSIKLNGTATITFPYPYDSELPDIPPVVLDSSDFYTPYNSSGELCKWNEPDLIDFDPDNKTCIIEVSHFSGFQIIQGHEPAYLVVDIPGKFLKPGDILITLTGGSSKRYNWIPGHVGLFCGRKYFASNEVVLADGGEVVPGEKGKPDIVEAVQRGVGNGSLELFRTGFTDDHIYLGAFRPPSKITLTDDDREKIVSMALKLRGSPYSLLGDGSNFLRTLVPFSFGIVYNKSGYSCVGLVDAIYNVVGKNLISWWDRHIIAVTPKDMYEETIPVSEITVKPGDKIDIPIYGVILDPSTGWVMFNARRIYTKNTPTVKKMDVQNYYDINVGGGIIPEGCTFESQYTKPHPPNEFGAVTMHWTPTEKQKGTWKFDIVMRASVSECKLPSKRSPGDVRKLLTPQRPLSQKLTIKVE